jgi:hypothetical protein
MDDRIVHGRIGKIGFMTDRRIIDPQGIINPDFLPYVKSNTMPEYYSALQPEYYIGDSLGLQCVVDGKGTAQQLIIFTYNAFPIRDNRTAHTEKISVYKLYWK